MESLSTAPHAVKSMFPSRAALESGSDFGYVETMWKQETGMKEKDMLRFILSH